MVWHHANTTGLLGHCRHSSEHRMVQLIVERRRRATVELKIRSTDVLMQRMMRLLLLLLVEMVLLQTLLLRMLRVVLVLMLLMMVIVRGVS